MSDAPRPILSPRPGYWLLRLAKNGPRLPAAIMWVHTTREPGNPMNAMERSPFLAAFIAGDPVSLDEVWLRRGTAIAEDEYNFRIADLRHARKFRPDDPLTKPREAIDLDNVPLPF